MIDLTKGDKLSIIRGIYKKFGTATYLKPYGNKMCTVKVHGDTAEQRNIWLTSVLRCNDNREDKEEEKVITLSRDEYMSLLAAIDDLKKALNKLTRLSHNECVSLLAEMESLHCKFKDLHD